MHIKLGLKLREVKGSLCNSKLQARLYILNTIEQETRTQHSELGVDNLVSQLILLSELKTSNSSHLYTNIEHVCLKWSTKPEFEFRVGSPYNDVVSIRRKIYVYGILLSTLRDLGFKGEVWRKWRLIEQLNKDPTRYIPITRC